MIGLLVLVLASVSAPSHAGAWGERGHRLTTQVAVERLPGDLPEFFRRARARLVDLSVEPDRWRVGELQALNRGAAPDHFLDFEYVRDLVDIRKPPPSRYHFLQRVLEASVLERHGLRLDQVGYAPYRASELVERLELQLMRRSLLLDRSDGSGSSSLARRIRDVEHAAVWSAGVLGHYVADLANPHHTTLHYNGWVGPNPKGYPTDPGVHFRFEDSFVRRTARHDAVVTLVPVTADLPNGYLRAVWKLTVGSNALVEELYELDRQGAFAPGAEQTSAGQRGQRFAHQRLAVGAALLRDLWVGAFRRGERRADRERVAIGLRRELARAGLGSLRLAARIDGAMVLSGQVPDLAARDRAVAIVSAGRGVVSVSAEHVSAPH